MTSTFLTTECAFDERSVIIPSGNESFGVWKIVMESLLELVAKLWKLLVFVL